MGELHGMSLAQGDVKHGVDTLPPASPRGLGGFRIVKHWTWIRTRFCDRRDIFLEAERIRCCVRRQMPMNCALHP